MSTYLERIGSGFDPVDPDLVEDFWATMTALREQCPAHRSNAHGGFVAFTRYEDVAGVAQDWRTFTSTRGVAPVPFAHSDFKLLPLEADPPFQRTIRRLLNPIFTPQAVRQYEDRMRTITVEVLDSFVHHGACEFVADFAAVLPGRVVYESILGLPGADFPKALGWIHQMVTGHGTKQAIEEYVGWIQAMFDARTAAASRSDVIDTLLEGEIDGRPLSPLERVQILSTLIIGALDTTESALTNIAYHLARDSSLAARLRSGEVDLDKAVDEFLRLDAPAPAFARTATADCEVAGEKVAAGERVLIYYGAANRDPVKFSSPDHLDFTRARNDHLSFGWGPHDCIGRHIAKLEIRVALEEILGRMQNLRLAPGRDVNSRVGFSLSPAALHLVFDPVAGDQR